MSSPAARIAVRNPEVEQRLRVIDASVRRTTSAILAAGLLIAGALLRPGDEVLGTVLLVAAILPALHVLAPWRSR